MTRLYHLQEAFKFALALGLSYLVALWMDWEHPMWAGFSVVTCSLATTGASLQRGILRLLGTITGCGLGLLLVAFFSQNPLGAYLAVLFLVVVCTTGMILTRYWYAWLVAAFVAVLVMASSYPQWDLSFEVAVERTSETALGILVYMIVSALLWPRYTGIALEKSVGEIVKELDDLYEIARRELSGEKLGAAFHERRDALVNLVVELDETLPAALLDTPSVRGRREQWRLLQTELRTFLRALLVWRESFRHVRELPAPDRGPASKKIQEDVAERLAEIRRTWRESPHARDTRLPPSQSADHGPEQPGSEQPKSSLVPGMNLLQQAALAGFTQQLDAMTRSSTKLLATTQVLVGIEPPSTLAEPTQIESRYWLPIIDRDTLLRVARPALAWTFGFLLWIYIEGLPGAQNMLVFLVALSMAFSFLNTSDPMVLGKPYAIGTIMAVPVYLFVLPNLTTSYGLFVVIVLYALPWGYIGSRGAFFAKVFGLLPLMIGADLTNQQTYSFVSFADSALMFVVVLTCFGLGNAFLPQSRPQDILRRNLGDLLAYSARVVAVPPGRVRVEQGLEARAQRALEAVLNLSRRLRVPVQTLAQECHSVEGRARIMNLLHAAQVLAIRISELEEVRHRAAHAAPGPLEFLEPAAERFRSGLISALLALAATKDGGGDALRLDALHELLHGIENRLAQFTNADLDGDLSGEQFRDLFLLTGSAHTLLEATAALDQAMNDAGLETGERGGLLSAAH